jgi:hypothetical protein
MKIAACVMTRNEERDIVEWCLYHAWLGFDAIVVFENKSNDRTREMLDSLKKTIDIRIFTWDQYDYIPGHFLAFEKCATDFRDEFDWIAMIDHDEFFVPIAHSGPKEYLQSMDAHAAVAINWVIYGSSGHVDYPNGLVTESFVHRAPFDLSGNRHVKSIIRPKEMVGCRSSHFMDMKEGLQIVNSKGEPFEWVKPGKAKEVVGTEDTVRLHHYFVRSRAHWDKRMAIPYMKEKRAQQNFEDYDFNQVFDPIVNIKFGDIQKRIRNFKEAFA